MNRKLITAAVAASALMALSSCGSSSGTEPTAKTSRSASAAAPSQAMGPSMAVKDGVVDGQMFATMVADAMVASKSAHMAMSTGGKPIADGSYQFTNPVNVDMKMSQQGISLQIVQIGGVLYVKGVPGMPTTTPWLKIDPKGADAFSKALASMGDLSRSNDPRAVVAVMKDVKGRDLGAATVGGVSTRHFSFEMTLSSYGRLLSPELLKAVRGTIKDPIVTDYWVGNDSLPRKIATVMTVSGKKQSTEILYSDWGKPVKIVAPSKAQVGVPPGSKIQT